MAKTNRNLLIIRWTARIIALFFILIMLLISIGEIMDSGEGGSPKGVEWLGILFMPVGVVVGLILAWKWEGLGGFIAFLSLIGFHLFLVL